MGIEGDGNRLPTHGLGTLDSLSQYGPMTAMDPIENADRRNGRWDMQRTKRDVAQNLHGSYGKRPDGFKPQAGHPIFR
jgi:hypothetical protein